MDRIVELYRGNEVGTWDKSSEGLRDAYYLDDDTMLCHRHIRLAPLPRRGYLDCDDCSGQARFIIVEDDGLVWYYCGICSLGG